MCRFLILPLLVSGSSVVLNKSLSVSPCLRDSIPTPISGVLVTGTDVWYAPDILRDHSV
jgi:hypothetical protein